MRRHDWFSSCTILVLILHSSDIPCRTRKAQAWLSGGHMGDGQDVEAALWSLTVQFQAHTVAENLPALVLTSQLRSVLQDSSCCLEFDLDRLQQTNAVRVFKLSTGPGSLDVWWLGA
ncbi:hypothetical protein V8C86DRAFT_2961226 [Haematococcus lacustris]